MGYNPVVHPIYKWVITRLLTIDPNFLGHPSRIPMGFLVHSEGFQLDRAMKLFEDGGDGKCQGSCQGVLLQVGRLKTGAVGGKLCETFGDFLFLDILLKSC